MSAFGTFETFRPSVTVSAFGGKPEVIGGGANRRDRPKADTLRCYEISGKLVFAMLIDAHQATLVIDARG
jgi:hypothetical protein